MISSVTHLFRLAQSGVVFARDPAQGALFVAITQPAADLTVVGEASTTAGGLLEALKGGLAP